MLHDIRYAIRAWRRTPALATTIVLTVAIAIAASTAIVSVAYAVLLRPLPFRDPSRIVQVAEKNDRLHLSSFSASVLNFLSWREQNRSFEDLGAVGFTNYTLTGVGEPEQLTGNRISPAVSRVLGLSAVLGRTFTDDEERPGAAPVAMIGEGLWKRRFGADPSLIGRAIVLNGLPTTVIGIAPASLNLVTGGDIYTPLVLDPSKEIRLNHVIVVFGRLREGVSLAQAQSDMDAVSRRMGTTYPEVRDWGIHLISLFETFVTPQLETSLLVLVAAVALLLVSACANIANLLLSRAASREGEMAMRTALGAGRARVFRQVLVEAVVVAVSGGAIGIAAAFGVVRVINHALPPNTLPVPEVQVDPTVLWFAAGLTVVTGLVFGLVPAWRASRIDLNGALKQVGRGSSIGRGRLRNALAAVELALATILLVAAGLLTQTLARLESVHLGFQPERLLTFQLAPPVQKYALNAQAPQLYRELIDQVRSLPGVTGAAVSSGIPFGAGSYTTHPMLTKGASVLPPETLVPIDWRIVSPGYFRAMGIPLLRGRNFSDGDGAAAQPVVIVSAATAKKFWGEGDPLGRTLIRSADRKTAFTVVGVVGDVRSTALTQDSPALYYPMAARVWPLMDVVVRTTGTPEAILPSVRLRIHALDPNLALANVRTMEDWVSNTAAQPRLNAVLLEAFAGLALLIAALGIYGVLAYGVSQRKREIGLRLAVGAQPGAVVRLFLTEGMMVALTGVGIGLAAAFAFGRALATLLYGVEPRDLPTYLGVALVLTLIALAACAIPARRAARVDPLLALRSE